LLVSFSPLLFLKGRCVSSFLIFFLNFFFFLFFLFYSLMFFSSKEDLFYPSSFFPFFFAFFSFSIFFLWLLNFLFFLLGGCGHLGDFLLLKVYHFAKQIITATWLKELLGKCSKKSLNFKEKSFEIVKVFWGSLEN
jgi:hypothetical protein